MVRSAVTFKTSIQSLLDLSVETPKCNKQYIWFDNLPSPNPYQINDLVFGSQTEHIGRVIEAFGEGYIVVLLFDDQIVINEYVINLIRNIRTSYVSTTSKTIVSVNGIVQSPGVSYTVSADNILPLFPIYPGDELTSLF